MKCIGTRKRISVYAGNILYLGFSLNIAVSKTVSRNPRYIGRLNEIFNSRFSNAQSHIGVQHYGEPVKAGSLICYNQRSKQNIEVKEVEDEKF